MSSDTLSKAARGAPMPATNIKDPGHFAKVIDCQYACPAHTPVPEYIRLIAQGRYADAYMLNWESNVFPGILGRVCDRPCEPACRRGRIELADDTKAGEPVAICRLKRVAADLKGDIEGRFPEMPAGRNGKRIALLGAGPASLTVARDLMPLGYSCVLFDKDPKGGGLMRSNIPSFRLPIGVLDEEVDRILGFGVEARFGHEIKSLKSVLADGYDAVFVGTGAPKGKDLPDLKGRQAGSANIHIGIDWLGSVAFEHCHSIGRRVVVIGGGNTAMDCCRTARRLGAEEVTVTVRSPRKDMKASSWEIEEAEHEGIPILDNHNPKEIIIKNNRLAGVRFERMRAEYEGGKRRLIATGEEVVIACDDVLMAIGQDNAFPWIERDLGLEFDRYDMPVVDKSTMMATRPGVFFGGDAAWGPENIIKAVAHGHQAAISIDLFCQGKPVSERPAPTFSLISQKMGIHEWSYSNAYSADNRTPVPHAELAASLKNRKLEVELGYDVGLALREAERCLNCDVETVFSTPQCIECDACADICPVDCINFIDNGPEDDLRTRLKVPAPPKTRYPQDLYVSDPLKTGRAMVKDEDVCVHCGLCAERCPTGAWDMQKLLYIEPQVSAACLANHRALQR